MFKSLAVILMFGVFVNALPQGGQVAQENASPIPIVSQNEENNADGSYSYSFEAGNGIKIQNAGTVKRVPIARYDGDGLGPNEAPREDDIIVQSGSYSYPAPDGTIITITYIADEKGFQPQGDSIPVPPPIPPQTLAALKQQSLRK